VRERGAVQARQQFETALATRDVIGQAKGMLMQCQNLTGIQAFKLLIKASSPGSCIAARTAYSWRAAIQQSGLSRRPVNIVM